jgi:hypothetical protein
MDLLGYARRNGWRSRMRLKGDDRLCISLPSIYVEIPQIVDKNGPAITRTKSTGVSNNVDRIIKSIEDVFASYSGQERSNLECADPSLTSRGIGSKIRKKVDPITNSTSDLKPNSPADLDLILESINSVFTSYSRQLLSNKCSINIPTRRLNLSANVDQDAQPSDSGSHLKVVLH